jgi:hypothetical protein
MSQWIPGRRSRFAALAIVILALPTMSSPFAAERSGEAASSAAVVVGATVVPFVRVEALSEDPSFTLTASDVERGLAEVAGAISMSVRTNSPRGYYLDFEIVSDEIWGVEILGLPTRAFVVAPRGRVLMPTQGPMTESLDLGFRVHLSDRARPGAHPWPIAVSVRVR